jgi:nitrogen fixation/metabolism regulation signal transduction histidine kinase
MVVACPMTSTIPMYKYYVKAQKGATGDFDQVLEVKSDDEIGKAYQTFNCWPER